MTSGKISDLKLLVLQHKPLVIEVIEMKLKRKDNRTIQRLQTGELYFIPFKHQEQ